jgi:hypothetical protein
MVINNEQAIAEAMGGWDIHMALDVIGEVQKGRYGFVRGVVLRSATIALWSKHESHETLGWLGHRGYAGHASSAY